MLPHYGYKGDLPNLTNDNDIENAISTLNNKFPLNEDFNFKFEAPSHVIQYIKDQIIDLPDEYQKYIDCKVSDDLAMVASIKTSAEWNEVASWNCNDGRPKINFDDKQGTIGFIKNNEGKVETAIVTPKNGNINQSSVVFSHKPLNNEELTKLLNNRHGQGEVRNVPIYNLEANSQQSLVGNKPSAERIKFIKK